MLMPMPRAVGAGRRAALTVTVSPKAVIPAQAGIHGTVDLW